MSATVQLTLIFDKNDLIASPYGDVAEGTSVTAEGWMTTDYVDVSRYVGMKVCLAARKTLQSVAFFDADRRYMSGIGTFSNDGVAEHPGINHVSVTTVQRFADVPEGAVYARFLTYDGVHDPMKDAAVVAYADADAYAEARSTAGWLSGRKIACIGDSLTEGDYGIAPCVANVHYRNYPFFLARLTGAETVNYGRCGASSSSYTERLYNAGYVDVKDADIVLLMLGTNLGLRDGLAEAYVQLVERVRADMKDGAQLILITPVHATEDPRWCNCGCNPNVQSAVEFIRAYAPKAGLPFIDAYADSPIQPENEDIYQANDGLHMCEAGLMAFATFIDGELKRILHTANH